MNAINDRCHSGYILDCQQGQSDQRQLLMFPGYLRPTTPGHIPTMDNIRCVEVLTPSGPRKDL